MVHAYLAEASFVFNLQPFSFFPRHSRMGAWGRITSCHCVREPGVGEMGGEAWREPAE